MTFDAVPGQEETPPPSPRGGGVPEVESLHPIPTLTEFNAQIADKESSIYKDVEFAVNAAAVILNGDPNPKEIRDEIRQDLMVKVLSKLGQFKGNAKFLTWLCRISRNIAFDILKSRQRRGGTHIPLDAINGEEAKILSVDSSGQRTESIMIDKILLAEYLAFLKERLTPDQMRLFIYSEIDGLSQKETAKKLGKSLSAMKSRKYRLDRELLRLRQRFERTKANGKSGLN